MRDGRIVGDPVEPGREAAVAFKRREAPESFQERVLGQFFRIFAAAYHPENEGVDRAAVFVEQRGETGGVSCLYPFDVICIGVRFHAYIMDAGETGRLQFVRVKIIIFFEGKNVTGRNRLRQIGKRN